VNRYTCPCGCALQLDVGQQAQEARLQRIAGSYAVGVLSSAPYRSTERREPDEPTVEQVCTGCGSKYQEAQFIAEFSATYGVRAKCERCRR